ncbi:MAG: hypothetical protein K8J31_16035 [Anaerolineae bacterium]|nr:hypothetical protein [Anaerolineae bacterium]
MARRNLLILAVIGLAACASPPLSMQERGPTRSVVTASQRMMYDFFDASTWDVFTVDDPPARFAVEEGALVGSVAADQGYLMSTNHVRHEDVLINATVQQTEGLLGNGFGVVCRADAQGDGYYFLISSDGEFTISAATPVRDDLFQLIPWQHHSVIRQGVYANDIRAVCAGNYLAMFINDVFVAEVFDDEFTSGQLGLVVGAVGQPAAVRFDNILVRDAILRGNR